MVQLNFIWISLGDAGKYHNKKSTMKTSIELNQFPHLEFGCKVFARIAERQCDKRSIQNAWPWCTGNVRLEQNPTLFRWWLSVEPVQCKLKAFHHRFELRRVEPSGECCNIETMFKKCKYTSTEAKTRTHYGLDSTALICRSGQVLRWKSAFFSTSFWICDNIVNCWTAFTFRWDCAEISYFRLFSVVNECDKRMHQTANAPNASLMNLWRNRKMYDVRLCPLQDSKQRMVSNATTLCICVASLCRAATLRNFAADVLSRKRSQQPFECMILSLRRRTEKVRITYNHNDDKFIIAFLDFCVAFHSPIGRSHSLPRTRHLCPSQSLYPNSFFSDFAITSVHEVGEKKSLRLIIIIEKKNIRTGFIFKYLFFFSESSRQFFQYMNIFAGFHDRAHDVTLHLSGYHALQLHTVLSLLVGILHSELAANRKNIRTTKIVFT